MVAPSRKRKNKIGSNIISNATNSFWSFLYRLCLLLGIVGIGIVVSLSWITFYTEIENLARYDDGINSFALNNDVGHESAVKENVRDDKDDDNINEYHILDVTEEEIQKSYDYVNSFTDESFQRPLTFFHIPKTAGTAIEHAAGMSNRSLSWGSCMFNHGRKRADCTYPTGGEWPDNIGWWHIPSHFFPLARINPYKQSELFGVIRDPYDRMVSEFYYICSLKIFPWRPDQCDNRTRLYDKEYMNEWIQRKLLDTQNHADRMTGKWYLSDNGHLVPQHEYVFAPFGVRMLDHVLTLDDPNLSLSDQFNQLMTMYGMPDIQLEKFNAFGAEDRSSGHLTVNELSDTTKELIEALYADDIKLRSKYRSEET